MSIYLDRDSKVIVQGITGRMAQFHTKEMLDDGTNVVGGVVPGKGGEKVFWRACVQHSEGSRRGDGRRCEPCVRAAALCRRLDHGSRRRRYPLLRLHYRTGIPAQDMIQVKRYMMRYPKERRMVLTGPTVRG